MEIWTTLAKACVTESDAQKPLLMAVDRDGTLVPITDNPDEAIVPANVRDQLRLLASFSQVTVAAVSARPVEKLQIDFGEGALILAGNYGLEISFPNGDWDIQASALDARDQLIAVKERLLNEQFAQWGVLVEDHLYTLCAHWHLTPPDAWPAIHKFVNEVVREVQGVKLIQRPTSYEIFPPIDWDKSHAMERIYTDLHEDCLPVYFGDSDADECAFEWVNQHNGISVRVGDYNPNSNAKYHVPAPAVVHTLLDKLADLLISHDAALPKDSMSQAGKLR
jgi:trehalose 6-phosphate phosphatase